MKSGEIIQYRTPLKLLRAKLGSSDKTYELSNVDSITLSANNGDSLLLSFKNNLIGDLSLNETNEYGIEMETSSIIKDPGGIDPDNPNKMVNSTLSSLFSNMSAIRKNLSTIYIPVNTINMSNTKLRFKRPVDVDYANVAVKVVPSFVVNELTLVSAIHNTTGNVLNKLSAIDSIYTTIMAGENIELKFSSSNPPSNMKRGFVFVVTGRYETIPDLPEPAKNILNKESRNTIITEYRLFQNYPNPFNPNTQITFQLPFDGYVKIIIYDILGRELKRLIEQNFSKGIHSVTWYTDNIATGLYICRYNVTDATGNELYNENKKVMLMK